MSQKALAKKSGLSQTTISDIERGRNDGSREILQLAEALGRVSALWLSTGRGDKYPSDASSAVQRTTNPVAPGAEFVPVSRVNIKASAGITGWAVEHIDGNGPPIFFRADWISSNGYKADRLYALRITGPSMEPGLYDGDLVVINSADAAPKDGGVFVVNYEGEVVVKRLKRDAGQWWLSSDNQDKTRHPDKLCDEHAQVIGRVIYRQSERI